MQVVCILYAHNYVDTEIVRKIGTKRNLHKFEGVRNWIFSRVVATIVEMY